MTDKTINAVLPYGSEQMEYSKTRIGNAGKMFLARYSSLFRERGGQKGIQGMEGGASQIKGTEGR